MNDTKEQRQKGINRTPGRSDSGWLNNAFRYPKSSISESWYHGSYPGLWRNAGVQYDFFDHMRHDVYAYKNSGQQAG